jgi:hypothetical protein
MLHGAWNVEHLSLKLDKASVEESWPHFEEPEALWGLEVSNNRYWKLQSLKLSGFVLEGQSFQAFMSHHKQTLTTVHFDNCDLDEPWAPVFGLLRDAPNLMELRLHQISELSMRVLWLDTEDIISIDQDTEDWVYVMFGMYHHFTLESNATAAQWDALSERLRLSRRRASPFAQDALSWFPEFLT